jgi:hypothetical protein
MRENTFSLSYTTSWSGALLIMHGDNFTFNFRDSVGADFIILKQHNKLCIRRSLAMCNKGDLLKKNSSPWR